MPVVVLSQEMPTKKYYKKGTIQLHDRKSFTGENLVFNSGQLTFKDTKTAQPVTVAIEDLKYIKAQTGSYAVEGALLGVLFAGTGILTAYGDTAGNPYMEVKESRIPYLVGGSLLLCTGIGAIFKKEKIIFKDNEFTTEVFIGHNKYSACSGKDIISIGLRFNFYSNQ